MVKDAEFFFNTDVATTCFMMELCRRFSVDQLKGKQLLLNLSFRGKPVSPVLMVATALVIFPSLLLAVTVTWWTVKGGRSLTIALVVSAVNWSSRLNPGPATTSWYPVRFPLGWAGGCQVADTTVAASRERRGGERPSGAMRKKEKIKGVIELYLEVPH